MASCFCMRLGKETVKTLDFRHCNLRFVPEEIFEFEDTLEELYLDSNDIRDLPRDIFHCQLLKKLGASDNELVTIPSAVASLIQLEELDISKNGIVELPDTIKSCKNLRLVEVSVNPLGKLPEGFTQLLNLTQLYLNDTLLDYLPANFGRLTRLKMLELRENRLKALPKSISRLTELERLDLGQNSFREIPEVIGSLTKLTELWIDANKVTQLPRSLGNLKALVYFDASCNRLEHLPTEMDSLESLTDLHLSKNFLHELPPNIGNLSSMTTLKADSNQLAALPYSIGGLVSLQELILSANDLEELPPSIGLLRKLRHLNVDDNMLQSIPQELGSCSNITLLSLRGNYLQVLPDEMGRISSLTVVNLSNNRLQCLPYSFTKLKNLQALWLSENQSKPLIPLQSELVDQIGTRVLTCFLFPQQPQEYDEDAYLSDGESFHNSVWEQKRARGTKIAFDVAESETEHLKNTARPTTPYPKETIRPRFRMGLTTNIPNGHIPSRRPHLAEKVHSPQMELLPSKPAVDMRMNRRVRGRRELELDGIRIREAKVTRPRSPGSTISDSLHLFQADKEKRAKDKARIRRSSGGESDVEAVSPSRSSKGFFKKSKADRAAHSDTEAVDTEWSPKKSNMRRSLTVDHTLSLDIHRSSPAVDERRSRKYVETGSAGKGDRPIDMEYRQQTNAVQPNRHSDSEFASLERNQPSEKRADVNRTPSRGDDMPDGVRRRILGGAKHHPDSKRWSSGQLNRNASGDSKHADTPPSSKGAFDGRRNTHQRRSGYGTDPELEELYHNSLDKDTLVKPLQIHNSQSKHYRYRTEPERSTPQRIVRDRHSNKNINLPSAQSGYGTDSEIMAYNGPFDYASHDEDRGRSSRGGAGTLERQHRVMKRPELQNAVHADQNLDEKARNQEKPVEIESSTGNVDSAQWAYPGVEGDNKSREMPVEERLQNMLHVSERKANIAKHKANEYEGELGRIATANAGLQRRGESSKEVEKSDKEEMESQRELAWDISDILGTSSRIIGRYSSDSLAHSNSHSKTDSPSQDRTLNGQVSSGSGNKDVVERFKSSTPEDNRQSDKDRDGVVKSGLNLSKARRIVDELKDETHELNKQEQRPTLEVKAQTPVPPYPKRRDPNSPLPPYPSQRKHSDSPLPPFKSNRPYPSPSPLPPNQYSRRTVDASVPPNTRPSYHEPPPNPKVPTQGNLPHSANRLTPGEPPKRPAIPSYEEALARSREAAHRNRSHYGSSPLVNDQGQLPSMESIHDNRGLDRENTTQARKSSERLFDDHQGSIDEWLEDPPRRDPQRQGQPHNREEHPRQGRIQDDGPLMVQRRDDTSLFPPQSQGPRMTPVPKTRSTNEYSRKSGGDYHSADELDGSSRQPVNNSDTGDYHRDTVRYTDRDNTEHYNPTEAEIHRSRARGRSPAPDYAPQRAPSTNENRHLHLHSHRPVDIEHGRRVVNKFGEQQGTNNTNEADSQHRRGSVDRQAPPTQHVVNEDNWRQHILARLEKKKADDGQQTPVSIRRPSDGNKPTVQEKRLQLLRARMQNEMHKTSEEASDDVFQNTVLPSRSPASTLTRDAARKTPNHHHQNQHQGTPTSPLKSWPEEQTRRGPPPLYPKDSWSSPHQDKLPPELPDNADLILGDKEELRRGTPPGSSGSSTTGGNTRSFAPSPSMQRRLHPFQPPSTQSPLPGRRADPDGIGGPKRIPVVIYKNPGLGFSITGGKNSSGNPFHPEDMGIFVTKVQLTGPADHRLVPGDKILEVNGRDFADIDHEAAVTLLKTDNPVAMVIMREA